MYKKVDMNEAYMTKYVGISGLSLNEPAPFN